MPKAALALFFLTLSQTLIAQEPDASIAKISEDDYPIKYAIYSTAWGTSSNAGLRIVTQNQSNHDVVLQSVLFQDEEDPTVQAQLSLNLDIPPGAWAEKEIPYVDLLFGNSCINKTLQEQWKLVEISNYTLNPSVRGLIIENSDSFRIYQCVRNVRVSWSDTVTGQQNDYTEWVMYHFERQYSY